MLSKACVSPLRGRGRIWKFDPPYLPRGGSGGAQFFFGGRAWGGLLKFQTRCTLGDGEGQGNFSTKFYQNVRAKTGGGSPQKLLPQQISLADLFTTIMKSTGIRGKNLTLPPGAGSSHPKVDLNFWRFSFNCLALYWCEVEWGRNYFYAAFRWPGHPEAKMCHKPGLACGRAG